MVRSRLIGIAWLIYAPIGGVALVSPLMVTLGESPTVFDIIDVPITGVAAVGLVAFLFRFRVLRPRSWQAFFPLLIAWDILHTLILGHLLGMAQHPIEDDQRILLTVFLLPAYLALFLYAHRSSQVWTGPGYPNPLLEFRSGWRSKAKGRMLWSLVSVGVTVGLLYAVAHFVNGWWSFVAPAGILAVFAIFKRLKPEYYPMSCRLCGFTRYGLWVPRDLRQMFTGEWDCPGCGKETGIVHAIDLNAPKSENVNDCNKD